MSDHRRGSLTWHIARLWEERRQLECGTTYYGWPEASAGHYANRAADAIADIDAEFAEAMKLLRELGLVQDDANSHPGRFIPVMRPSIIG